MPTTTTRVLFVCTGNTCRSPMAQVIGQAWALGRPSNGLAIEISSAGVAAGPGQSASIEAIEVMQERGIDLSRHSSRQLTFELVEDADIVLTMTPAHTDAAKRIAPELSGKISPLDPDHPIADPIGQSVEVYRLVADQLENLIDSRLKEMINE